MKIKIIPALLLIVGSFVNAQVTTKPGASVFVDKNTIFFSTGDVTVETGSTFINSGNVEISTGTLKTPNDNNSFVLSYSGALDYGQLIIRSGIPAQGKIKISRVLSESNDVGSYASFSPPFQGYTMTNFYQDLGLGSSVPSYIPCTPWRGCDGPVGQQVWNDVPMIRWFNGTFRQDPVLPSYALVPGNSYLIRKDKFGGSVNLNGIIKEFHGTPFVANGSVPTGEWALNYPNRAGDANFAKIGSNARNIYRIPYFTYLFDPFSTVGGAFGPTTTDAQLNSGSTNYADWLLQVSNPYTSNIDLRSLIPDKSTITGVYIYGATTGESTLQTRFSSQFSAYSIGTDGKVIGNEFDIIPPMTTFVVKGKSGGNLNNLYSSSIQVFTPAVAPIPNSVSSNSIVSSAVGDDVYQVNLKIYRGAAKNNVPFSNTYVAANRSFETGKYFDFEAANLNILQQNSSGIYTIPESVKGGADPKYINSKLYINVLNTNSEKIAIPLGINISPDDKSQFFTITSELIDNQQLLPAGKKNYDDPNARFYFYDKQLNVLKEIDSNFTYTFTQPTSTNDRFQIFWKEAAISGGGGDDGGGGSTGLDGETTVYRSGDSEYVRFNKDWKKADINVYNSLGQLVSSVRGIDVQNGDYQLPINGMSLSMYIVRIVNDKGEIITKKIIK